MMEGFSVQNHRWEEAGVSFFIEEVLPRVPKQKCSQIHAPGNFRKLRSALSSLASFSL
jgi:hypothetical protein